MSKTLCGKREPIHTVKYLLGSKLLGKFLIANIILIAEALFLFWCKILFFIKVFVIYIFHPREVYFGRANLGKHETVVKLLAAVVFRRLH